MDKRSRTVPLTRADLEAIAERTAVRIDDLWPAIEAGEEDEEAA